MSKKGTSTKKEKAIASNEEFWTWFQKNEERFFNAVKTYKNIEKNFFDILAPKLAELKEGYFYLTGMYDDDTVELILTAEGNAQNIVFVEELVNAAPTLKGWKFTALKPPTEMEDASIEMAGYEFNCGNMSFYSNENDHYPDIIDITVVHNDLTKKNKKQIENGVYIFLDNCLGELEYLNTIDNLEIIGKKEAKKEVVPLTKLKDFLVWRQKEFVEKYEATRYNTENDNHSMLRATLKTGNMLLAVVNTELLNWESKASHPWIAILIIKYTSNDGGMPIEEDYKLMDKIEDEMLEELKDSEGYLNIGRQTAEGEREIYFACKDFRKPSKVFFNVQQNYSSHFEIEIDIYKDKYWLSFERFRRN